MKWLLRAVTVLFVLCLSALAVAAYHSLRASEPERPMLAQASSSDETTGQFTRLPTPRPAPAFFFRTLDSQPATLAAFRGHVLLVNLWATWCGPCVAEMPSLLRLQAKLPQLSIIAISEDRQGAGVVRDFIAKHRLAHLAIFLDPETSAGDAFGVTGLPTSFLIDADGEILGKLEGAADWDAPDMLGLLRRYVPGHS
jgi:thiol-disulfide isomerase/thioredoxin